MFSWRYMRLTTPTHVREQKALNITNSQICLLQKFQVLRTSACWVGWHVLPPHTFKLCSQYDTKACMFCCFTLSLHLNHAYLWPDAKLLLWGLDPSFSLQSDECQCIWYSKVLFHFIRDSVSWLCKKAGIPGVIPLVWPKQHAATCLLRWQAIRNTIDAGF